MESVTTSMSTALSDVLGNDLDMLITKIKNHIEKKGFGYADFSQVKDEPVFDFVFPKPSKEMGFRFIFYDGEAAYRMLVEFNDLNRPIKLEKVVEEVINILTGKWRETHQGIGFTWENPPGLLDGQHRSLAIYIASKVNSAVKIKLLTVFNCDPATRDVVDIGRNRTAADKLVMNVKITDKGISFVNDKLGEIPARQLYSAVCAMPSRKGFNEEDKIKFGQNNIGLISNMLNTLTKMKVLRYNAAWAGVFIDAAYAFGIDNIKPLAERFVNHQWKEFGDSRIDPLFALFIKLSNNKNNNRTLKMTAPAVSLATTYAIRKSLLEESVPEKQGSRHEARYSKFTPEEVTDFKQHGKHSKILKSQSVARHDKKKKEVANEVAEENSD